MSQESPFPGMDPYLEQHWRDVHASLIVYSSDQIQVQLPDDLVANVHKPGFADIGGAERLFGPL
jgi:hypothetical protein